MEKEVFVDKHAFIDVVHVDEGNIKDIYRELHPQSLGDDKYLYWRPTGMGEDEAMRFEIGDYLVRRWDGRIDDWNWFCYSKDEWLSEKKYYMKIAKNDVLLEGDY